MKRTRHRSSERCRTLRHAIRWRAPRASRVRRKPQALEPVLHVRAVAMSTGDSGPLPSDDPPETLRDPSVVAERAHVEGRPALFEALCASLELLAAESVACELDIVIDAGASARLYRDPDLAARLVSPFVAGMPLRDGLVPVGTVRIAGRKVRIYERAA